MPVFLCSYSLGKMAFEAAAMRRQWPLQAWDMGPCAWRLPGLPQLVMCAEPPAQVANSVVGGPPGLAADAVSGPARGSLRGVKRKSGPPPGLADEKDRRAATEKWVAILRELAGFGAMYGKFRPAEVHLYIAECAAIKSTQTLHLRAGSWKLYMAWASARGVIPYPLEPEVVEEYLRHAAGVAATRGSRFLEAVAFAQYTFGVESESAFTARARGIAALGYKKKKAIRQSAPFTVALVSTWEANTVAAAADPGVADLAKAICVGHFLWLVHTRSRFGDSARVTVEPVLDMHHGEGYIEAYALAGEYKSGHALKKVGRRFPMVGWATGVTGLPWAAAWLKLRAFAGCDAAVDRTLMPEVLSNGQFGTARMTTQDGTLILRQLLRDAGVSDVGACGTHSSKATLLSWAAKAGLSNTDRKLLGGHADSKDKSMEEYSRDVLAKPLLALGALLQDVRTGRFNPDATRSGRWQPRVTEAAQSSAGGGTATQLALEDEVEDPLSTADAGEESVPAGSVAPSSPDKDDSSDTTEQEDSAEEGAADLAGRAEEGAVYPEMPSGGIWHGSARGCIHRGLGQDTPHAACGYGLKWVTAKWLAEWPDGAYPLCRRASCFPV